MISLMPRLDVTDGQPKTMLIDEAFHFPPKFAGLVEACWQRSNPPSEWGVTPEQFQRLLERSVIRRFPGSEMDPKGIEKYLDGLHVEELALAGACSAGNVAAWDFFVKQFRPELYRFARTIAGESCGREIADSLYADLYGLREAHGRRQSLFDYFHGRSKLSTWLRAILAQRHVDEIRRARRTEPLDDAATEDDRGPVGKVQFQSTSAPHDPDRLRFIAMLQSVLTAVLATLDSRDRLRLAYYYVDGLTLAQIGKLLGEHEASVSRKLNRSRHSIRKSVEETLLEEKKLSPEQLRLCFEYAQEEWPFDLTRALSLRD
jgi:RNA polymerase sigma factor (sigma-70 family)